MAVIPTATLLYETGNISYHYGRGVDADIALASGNFRNFYQIGCNGGGMEDFRLIPDTGYTVFGSGGNIIYTETTGTYPVQFKRFNGIFRTATITAKNENRFLNSDSIYYPDTFDPAQHLLIVYNSGSQDSIDIKNYYLSVRTGFQNANILGVNTASAYSGEMLSIPEWTGNIRQPILNFISGNPDKPIRYVILMYDIGIWFSGMINANPGHTGIFAPNYVTPDTGVIVNQYYTPVSDLAAYYRYSIQPRTTINETKYWNDLGDGNSALTFPNSEFKPYSLSQFGASALLVTHVTARSKQDISGYISKLQNARTVNSYYLGGTGTNNRYQVIINGPNDSPVGPDSRLPVGHVENFYSGMLLYAPTSNPSFTVYQTISGGGYPRFTGGNLAGFVHRANFTDDPANNGMIKFTGYNWYITMTQENNGAESLYYNGSNWVRAQQIGGFTNGGLFDYITQTSYYGTNYENGPMGSVGNVRDQGEIFNYWPYFLLWHSGYPFIECAYKTRHYLNTIYGWTCIGDPLLVK